MYALISVSDKTHLDTLCEFLLSKKYKIISTGGTYKYILEHFPNRNDDILQIDEITQFPEILNGRVKTLHPMIYGSLLYDRSNENHQNEVLKHQIPDINLVVVNLYPFEKIIKNNSSYQEIIENIDIGGHTLIRACIKNNDNINILTNPNQYDKFIVSNLDDNKFKQELVLEALNYITNYDNCIESYFLNFYNNNHKYLRNYTFDSHLKYGCNPYQDFSGIFSINSEQVPFKIINGNFGYINAIDALNSWQLVKELSQTLGKECAASFKHTSPAGVGTSKDLSPLLRNVYNIKDTEYSSLSPSAIAFIRARNTDPMSSFGDFIAISHIVDKSCALQIKKEVSDGIIAPDYTPEALEILKNKKNGKYIILQANNLYENTDKLEFREIYGMALCQSVNNYKMDINDLGNIVTNNQQNLDLETRENLAISNITLKYSQSNNVAISYDGQLIGLAAGQQNRVDCVRLAGEKAKLWWCRQNPQVLYLNDLFKANIKKQDKINAIIRYIQNDFTTIEKQNWNLYFDKIPEPVCISDRDVWYQINSQGMLASDGFFPFRDNIDISSKYNIKHIIQPGGSMADSEIIDVCNQYNINMIFTGSRLFYH